MHLRETVHRSYDMPVCLFLGTFRFVNMLTENAQRLFMIECLALATLVTVAIMITGSLYFPANPSET
jgi:hypothetical protein